MSFLNLLLVLGRKKNEKRKGYLYTPQNAVSKYSTTTRDMLQKIKQIVKILYKKNLMT